MIGAMARCGRILEIPEFLDSANSALEFVYRALWRDRRLLATSKDGKSRLNAYLDDYVFLLDGILQLLQARWQDRDITFAIQLADTVLDHFEDADAGGLYFTSDDHETLLHRSKQAGDDSIPSGNGIGALCLLRLGHLLGEQRYLTAADKILKVMSGSIVRYPSGHSSLLIALQESLKPTRTIVLRGSEPELSRWRQAAQRNYAPRSMVLAIPDSATTLPGVLAERGNRAGTTAYICDGFACQPPVTDLASFCTVVEQL